MASGRARNFEVHTQPRCITPELLFDEVWEETAQTDLRISAHADAQQPFLNDAWAGADDVTVVTRKLNQLRGEMMLEIRKLQAQIKHLSDNLVVTPEQVMEDFRQQLNSLARQQNHIEAKLQGLSSHVQQGNVSSLNEGQPSSAGGFKLTYSDMVEEHQARPAVQERRHIGVTVDFLEVEAREMYTFQGSTWDVVIFIGTPSLGLGGSLATCALLLIKVIMQSVFIGIVWFNFSEATVNDASIEHALRWRINSAHDYQYMDVHSGHSLVSRVCQHDKSLQIASSQEWLHHDISEYLNLEATGLETLFVGKTLCVVALMCWFLMVSKEVQDAVDLLRAMVNLNRGIDKLEPVERPGHKTMYRIARISRTRLIFSAIIVAYRMVCCGLLAVSGTYFLVYTIQITELVLNAVALDIILNIDDLLFAAMATANAKHLVSRMESLEMPRWPHRKGCDFKAVCMAGTIFGAVVIVYCRMISPMVDDLTAVADAMCGGTRNFVYSDNPVKMTLFATTPSCTEGCKSPMKESISVKDLAVHEVVRQGQRNNSQYAIWVGDYHSLLDRETSSFEQAAANLSQGICADRLEGPYLHYMQQIMANESISGCNEVKQWCSSVSFAPEWGPDGGKGLMARLLCPRTCGCDDPGGGRIFISGCPAACTEKAHPVYAKRLNRSGGDCIQESLSTPTTNATNWEAWATQIRQYATFKNDRAMMLYSDQMVSELGCLTAYRSAASRLCIWADKYKAVFKGLAFFCPQTCYCYKTSKRPSCPDPCYHRRRRRRRSQR